jgi:hypothetical protein
MPSIRELMLVMLLGKGLGLICPLSFSLIHAKGVLTGRHTKMERAKEARDGLIAKVFLFFICSRWRLRFARRRITPRMIIQIWPLA